ncbi:MAG: N-acetylmuramoyl-L-alanine amidase [Alphaproteobacteria bacterium]|nr:N-acetylmuramoyl-L-alanine amidase [Alphaproteobacteria bacterium]
MTPVLRPSPNHDERGADPVDVLVLHYTGMRTAGEALARLCDPAAKVSAHYTVDRDGTVYAHVPEERRAWHAGLSFWAGTRNVNARSIGIEIVNPGHEFGYIPFTDDQIGAVVDLASGILERHPIPARNVVGHSDVAPMRKQDPGELFPWARLAEYGIGMWPPAAVRGADLAQAMQGEFRDALARYGYDPQAPLSDVVTAFQRHFRPSCVDGIADAECEALLFRLLAL